MLTLRSVALTEISPIADPLLTVLEPLAQSTLLQTQPSRVAHSRTAVRNGANAAPSDGLHKIEPFGQFSSQWNENFSHGLNSSVSLTPDRDACKGGEIADRRRFRWNCLASPSLTLDSRWRKRGDVRPETRGQKAQACHACQWSTQLPQWQPLPSFKLHLLAASCQPLLLISAPVSFLVQPPSKVVSPFTHHQGLTTCIL